MSNGKKPGFSTKAKTLAELMEYEFSFIIPPLLYFTVAEWELSGETIVSRINKTFDKPVAVRSSAAAEDTGAESLAGAFTSILHVDPKDSVAVKSAVVEVKDSYGQNINPEQDHILVQEMAENITLSGVVMTKTLDTGAPYYVINYDDESGRTDTITSGTGENKTILVYHKTKDEYFSSKRLRKIVQFVAELENHFIGANLDIEFGVDNANNILLFQVRPIAAAKNWRKDLVNKVRHAGGEALLSEQESSQHHKHLEHINKFFTDYSKPVRDIYGRRTILSNMGDWNPAEMIGADPSPLAASLYRYLITSEAWSIARKKLGYRILPKSDLMILLSGSPYIDLRMSFNSFLPHNLTSSVGEKIVNAWLDRVDEKPNLHDKIEFEVAQTIFDFDFEEVFKSRYNNCLNSEEFMEFTARLHSLTLKAVSIAEDSSIKQALYEIEWLGARQQPEYLTPPKDNPVHLASWLKIVLSDCIRYGTLPFSILARHGFIAEALMRSAIRMGTISVERVNLFKESLSTVLGDLSKDCYSLKNGDITQENFIQRYGHLRPGTYDIMSKTYREMPELISQNFPLVKSENNIFSLSAKEEKQLDKLFSSVQFKEITAQSFLTYFKFAIQAREYGKFIFSKSLSAVLDGIVYWGNYWGLSREDLAYLRIEDILATAYTSSQDLFSRSLSRQVEYAKIERDFNRKIKLGGVIRHEGDLYIVPLQSAEPNFIGSKRVEAECQILHGVSGTQTLAGKIVCIESADPGYDFIFGKGIKGLITQYGGANSHMAIRSSELGLPAAIGCGENIFSSLETGRRVGLYCDEKTIRLL